MVIVRQTADNIRKKQQQQKKKKTNKQTKTSLCV
jgi:hypothetical protein